ncbi:MAG: hypothetical protein JNL82_15185 [Myxococcales bacterium]|nr:hypothetical protein [Myxococcales bacterium]
MPYTLHNKDTKTLIGPLSDQQRQDLIDFLVEESADDRDYFIDEATLEHLEEQGADADLLSTLRRLLEEFPDGFEIEWREV